MDLAADGPARARRQIEFFPGHFEMVRSHKADSPSSGKNIDIVLKVNKFDIFSNDDRRVFRISLAVDQTRFYDSP